MVFIIDSSSSIENPEWGGRVDGVAKLAYFAADIVDELDDNIGLGGIRVATVTIADEPTPVFAFPV